MYKDSLEIVNISSCADNDDATPCSPTHEGKIYHGRTSGKDINGNEYTTAGADTNGAAIDYPFDVFVQGDYAYVVSRNSDALEIVDVSTPSNPIHIGKITNGTGGAALDYPRSVFVKGNYAYITSLDSHALEIVNISEPATPTHEGKIYSGRLSGRDSSNEEYTDGADTDGNGEFTYYEDDDGNGAALATPISIFVEGNYAYIVSQHKDALEIIDISNPSNPTHTGKIYKGRTSGKDSNGNQYITTGTDTNGAALNNPQSVFIQGNYAYIVSEISDALEIVNISDPSNPTYIGKITDGTGGAVINGPESVFVQGNYAYVVSRYSDALEIVELENTYTAEVAGTDTDSAYGVTIKDATGHTNRYGTVPEFATTSITTKSNNTNPRVAKNGDKVTITITLAKEVSIVPNKPTITVGSTIIDRDDITVVTTIPNNQTKDTFEYSFTVTSAQNGEVTVEHNGYSQITTLSRVAVDNTEPTATPTLTTSNADNTKAEVGDILTLTVSTNKEVLFNNATLGGETINFQRNLSHEGKITNREVARLSLISSIFVQGNYAYIISQSHALVIVNISDPTNPTYEGRIINGTDGAVLNYPRSVFIQGNYAYIASWGSHALEIVNISSCADNDDATPCSPTHEGKIYHGRTSGKDNNGNQYTTTGTDANGAALNYPQSVFVQGNYAYIVSTISDVLEIVDISEPTNPIHVGKLKNGTGGAALRSPISIFVRDNYTYIVSSETLEIVNISDPENPTHAGKIYNGRTSGKDNNGNEYTSQVSDSSGAVINNPQSVFIQGDYAYVASSTSHALEIVNISDPTNPTHAGKIYRGRTDGTHASALSSDENGAALNWPTSVFVQGDYAYVASSSSNALQVINISDPTNPTHAGKIENRTDGAELNNPQSVFVQGDYAYIASYNSNALEIIELENTYTASIPITRQVANNKAFNNYSATIKDAVGNTRNVSRTFTTITTDIPPLDITSYSDTANGARDGYINSEETTGNLITALGVRAGTAQYAVTTPTTNCNTNALTYTTTIPTTTSLSTDTTYKVCARVVNGTKTSYNHDILITKDTTAPETTTFTLISSNSNNQQVATGDTITLTATSNEEISLNDITIGTQEPTNFLRNISHEGKITNGQGGAALSRPQSIFVKGDYAYIASSSSNALEIVNISDSSSPTHEGKIYSGRLSGKDSESNEYTTAGTDTNGAALDNPYSVFVQGNYAYIASYNSNALEIVNISDPENPTHAGKIINEAGGAALHNPQSVFVQGNYAYVTSAGSGALEILNISDPENLTHEGKIYNGRASGKDNNGNEYTTAGTDTNGAALDNPTSVFVQGNYAYIASYNSNTLEIVNISDPENPTHAGKIINEAGGAALHNPQSVFVQGNYAYIASAGSNTLEIVNISNPASPTHEGKIYHGRASGKDSSNNEYTTTGTDTNGAEFNNPYSVFVQGNYAYVTSIASDTLEIVDISNPKNPTHAGKITNGTGGAVLDYPTSIFVQGNHAYVTSIASDALEIVELENTYTTEVTATTENTIENINSLKYGFNITDIADNKQRYPLLDLNNDGINQTDALIVYLRTAIGYNASDFKRYVTDNKIENAINLVNNLDDLENKNTDQGNSVLDFDGNTKYEPNVDGIFLYSLFITRDTNPSALTSYVHDGMQETVYNALVKANDVCRCLNISDTNYDGNRPDADDDN